MYVTTQCFHTMRPKAGGGHEAIGTAFGGGVVELAKTRRVQFLRDAHSSDQSSET